MDGVHRGEQGRNGRVLILDHFFRFGDSTSLGPRTDPRSVLEDGRGSPVMEWMETCPSVRGPG